jgi:hypothetical protein
MKKHIYFFACIIFSIYLRSQSPLTIGMVYDFSIGDTICFTQTPNLGIAPPTSYTNTFLQKTIKVDTIIYQIKQSYYTPPACPTCTPSFGTNTYSYQVVNLNSLAQYASFTNTTCTILFDTIYVNNCGTTIMFRENETTPSCFEPTMYTSYLYEGLGSFYSYTINNSVPSGYGFSNELTFYHKVGQPRCSGSGQPLAINENQLWDLVSIFPNPSINQNLSIKNNLKDELSVSMCSADGKSVYELKSRSSLIEINETFEKGIYFVRLTKINTNESIVRKWIIL